MLKRAYVNMAQGLPAFWPMNRLYADPAQRDPEGWGHWFASLGAIYHLDRMVALDIPWWNVAATGIVARFLRARGGARVFEYGSGASTVWLSRRAGSVVSVEHHSEWADKVRRRLAGFSHASLIASGYDPNGPPAEQPYVRTIEGTGQYDLIVVDGRLRSACLPAAIPHLKPDGMIVFDDSGRARYRAAIAGCGLIERHFHSRSYCVPYPDHTSLLARSASLWA